MLTDCGLFMYCSARRRISAGMVAEKRAVWRVKGVLERMVSISSTKPILSISSASSSTRVWTWLRLSTLRSIRSIKRPGVPTMMSTPRCSRSICGPYACPPYTARTRAPLWRPYSVIAPATCKASSRVGVRTRPWGNFWWGSRLWIMGRAKAAVLPVPVCAWPITSCPASMSGITPAWIGVGLV